jgi:hypothetical protein
VNVVRSAQQVETLRAIGATHVCDSSGIVLRRSDSDCGDGRYDRLRCRRRRPAGKILNAMEAALTTRNGRKIPDRSLALVAHAIVTLSLSKGANGSYER